MIDFTVAEIARALDGRKSGNGWVCKCVTHDDKNPSLSIGQGDEGRVLVHCHAGCNARDVIAELDRRGLWPKRQHPNREPWKDQCTPEQRLADARQRWQKEAADNRADAAFAKSLWKRAVDPGGTPAVDYLNGRHLDLDEGMAGRLVRYLEDCPRGRNRAQAMLVRFVPIIHPCSVAWGEDPEVECVQRIFLDPGKPKGHNGKQLMGHPFDLPKPELRNGQVHWPARRLHLAMKMTPDEEVEFGVHVAEGFETGLALMMLGFRPLWSVYSSGAMERFPLLRGIECLTLAADHDSAGLAAAQQCAERWAAAGREAFIRWPKGLGRDYADELAP